MLKSFAKNFVFWSISKGLRLPQRQFDRVNELTFLKDLMAQLEIDCVLDVGANCGQFASELRRIGYCGLIVSFEPVGTEFRALQDRFKKDLQWRGCRVALGSRDETRSIMIPNLTDFSSFLEPIPGVAEEWGWTNCRAELVEIRRLDGLLPSLLDGLDVARIFLKMDTQGYDLEVFKGASGCLERIQGIQSEISVQPIYKNMPHYLESLETYEAAGFGLYNLSVVNRTVGGGLLLEMNCLMRRSR